MNKLPAVLAALMLAVPAFAQTRPSISPTGVDPTGRERVRASDLEDVFQPYADSAGLDAAIGRALTAERAEPTRIRTAEAAETIRATAADAATGAGGAEATRAKAAGAPPQATIAGAAQNWSVCSSGCTYTTPIAAWNAARALTPRQTAPITIVVAHGTYSVTDQFFTDCPCDKWISLLGDTASPASVVLTFPNIVGNNFSAFVAIDGGRIGLVDGFTMNGVGAQLGATRWASQSYGAAFHALGSGSTILVGPHVNAGNFYYSLFADEGGRIVANGATFHDAGDANLLARFSSVIECRMCTIRNAADISADRFGNQVVLGQNALAEGGSLYVDNSVLSGGHVACIGAQTNGRAWAHSVDASGCALQAARATQLGFIELNHASLHNSGTGAYATLGGALNLDFTEIYANQYDGVLIDGGRAQGTAVHSHDNGTSGGGYGIKIVNAGYGAFYSTASILTGNKAGRYSRSIESGCYSVANPPAPVDDVPCMPASTLIIPP